VIRRVEPDAGRVLVDEVDFATIGWRELMRRRRLVQMVFQDLHGSPNASRSRTPHDRPCQ
jgi:ABC-type proline/glycine betaine transport system ATPase subunit